MSNPSDVSGATEELVLVEVAARIATVTLNRPRQRNALSRALQRRIREVLTALREGEISTPFKRDAGYHIFKVLGRSPETEYKYEDIKDDLKKVVTNRKLEEAYRRWYDRIKKNVNVELKE